MKSDFFENEFLNDDLKSKRDRLTTSLSETFFDVASEIVSDRATDVVNIHDEHAQINIQSVDNVDTAKNTIMTIFLFYLTTTID